MLHEAGGTAFPIGSLKGHLLQYIEAARFNERVALARTDLRGGGTAAEGRPHASADIETVAGGGKWSRRFRPRHRTEPIGSPASKPIPDSVAWIAWSPMTKPTALERFLYGAPGTLNGRATPVLRISESRPTGPKVS